MTKKIIVLAVIFAFVLPGFSAEKAAEVTAEKGRVEIVHGDAVMGKRARLGSELVLKDILRTKRRGYAEVGFVDGSSVKVFEKSRLTINGIERTKDGYNAEIQKGKVLFKVEKMASAEGDFRVKTTNSIIGVKGTTFGIVSGGLVTIVEVYNGHVEVLATGVQKSEAGKVAGELAKSGAAGKGGDAKANKATLVASLTSGQGAVLSSSGDVQVYEFTGAGNKSLLFSGAGGEKGEKGGDDNKAFNALGGDEEGGAGGDGGDNGDNGGGNDGDNGVGNGLGNALGHMGGVPGGVPGVGDPGVVPGDVADIIKDASDFYSSPDVKPDTEDQINLATGNVNIHISFK